MISRVKRMSPDEYNNIIKLIYSGFRFLFWTIILSAVLMLINSIIMVNIIAIGKWAWILHSAPLFFVNVAVVIFLSAIIVWMARIIKYRRIYKAPFSYWWVVAFGHPLKYEQFMGRDEFRYASKSSIESYLKSKDVGLYYDFSGHLYDNENRVYFADKNDALRLVLDKPQ